MARGGHCWTRQELEQLDQAIAQVPSTVEKQKRWRMIADIVGSRGKRECYEQYKLMKDSKKSEKAESKEDVGLDHLLNGVESKFTISGRSLNTISSSSIQKQSSNDDDYSDDFDEEDDLDGLLDMVGEKSSNQSSNQPTRHVEAKHHTSPPLPHNDNFSNGGGGGIRLGRGLLRAEAKHQSDSTGQDYKGEAKASGEAKSNEECNTTPIDLTKATPACPCKRDPITIDQANGLRDLLFNDQKKVLPDAWKLQGLFFSERKLLKYGLVQRCGGPCGVLASVQAMVLRHLGLNCLDPSPAQQQRALLLAIADMLIMASSNSGGEVVVCIPTGKAHLYRTGDYKPDGVSDDLELVTINDLETASLALWLEQHFHHFTEENGSGAVLVLFSVIFTRGLEQVRSDMDEGFTGEVRTLLDAHAYMSQEGVNLLITGRAKSNVFDGDRCLEDTVSGSKDVVRLGGIAHRSVVGFLTLQEAYNYLEVGENFKSPHFPAWVVYSESHYSVLFRADEKKTKNTNAEELYYWDMLAGQREVIKLSVVSEHNEELPDVNDERALIPPLDLVIRTKWKGCLVDWNGTEEIL